jgi:curved DNA-binding protein CbpA
MDDMHRYYEILGLSQDASIEARKQAYKDLVKVWHPDRFSHDPRLQQKAQEKLQEINEAYEKIKSLKNNEAQMTSWKKEHQDSSFETQQAHKPFFTEKVRSRKQPKRNMLVWIWFFILLIGFSVILSQVTNRPEHAPSQHRDASSSESSTSSSLITDRKTYFTIGSMKNEVQEIQGTPSSIIGDTWFYDASQITFSNGRVTGYSNNSGNLHMKLLPKTDATHIREKGYFTIGSTKDEVIALQGTPDGVIGNTWIYDLSQIKFYNDKVVSCSNVSKNLKVKTEK